MVVGLVYEKIQKPTPRQPVTDDLHSSQANKTGSMQLKSSSRQQMSPYENLLQTQLMVQFLDGPKAKQTL